MLPTRYIPLRIDERWRSLAGSLVGQMSFISNASYLVIGPAVSALAGFVFWLIAARQVPPEAQGLAAAAIASLNLTAFVSEFGLHTLIMGHAARHRDCRVVSAGLMSAMLLGTALAALFVILANFVMPTLSDLVGSDLGRTLFVFGAAVTALSITLDGALLGLFAGRLRMYREIVSAVLKLICLATVMAVIDSDHQALGLVLAWVAAVAGSVAFAGFAAWRRKLHLWQPPDFSTLGRLSPQLVGHHWLNLAAVAPGIAFPVLVAEVLSPATNAAFYLAWMIVQAVLLAPAGLAMALYPLGTSQPERIAARLRLSLVICTAIAIGAGLACFWLLEPTLAAVNPALLDVSGSSMRLIGFSAIALMIKYHYISVMRLQGRLTTAAAVLTAGSAVELIAAGFAGRAYGIDGLTLAWLAAVALQAIVLLPTVVRAMSEQAWKPRSIVESAKPVLALTPCAVQS